LRRTIPGARFVVVGDGPEPFAARLRSRPEAVALGDHLRWAGGVDDRPAAYNALDVAVLSSTAEGFPNAVAGSHGLRHRVRRHRRGRRRGDRP
jgi:glycosyltransferase involved in cell wall biosynthesis